MLGRVHAMLLEGCVRGTGGVMNVRCLSWHQGIGEGSVCFSLLFAGGPIGRVTATASAGPACARPLLLVQSSWRCWPQLLWLPWPRVFAAAGSWTAPPGRAWWCWWGCKAGGHAGRACMSRQTHGSGARRRRQAGRRRRAKPASILTMACTHVVPRSPGSSPRRCEQGR